MIGPDGRVSTGASKDPTIKDYMPLSSATIENRAAGLLGKAKELGETITKSSNIESYYSKFDLATMAPGGMGSAPTASVRARMLELHTESEKIRKFLHKFLQLPAANDHEATVQKSHCYNAQGFLVRGRSKKVCCWNCQQHV